MKRYHISMGNQINIHSYVTFAVETSTQFTTAKALESELERRLENLPYSGRSHITVEAIGHRSKGHKHQYKIQVPYFINRSDYPELPIPIIMQHLDIIEQEVAKAQNIQRLAALAE